MVFHEPRISVEQLACRFKGLTKEFVSTLNYQKKSDVKKRVMADVQDYLSDYFTGCKKGSLDSGLRRYGTGDLL
jgi:hypothetical protein